MAIDIKWIGSPNFNAQNNVSKLFITDHWMVGTLSSTDSAFNSGRAASATYGVGETEVHQYVQEKDYPYSDGNTYANQHTISIEHEGGYLLDDGTRKVPSLAVLDLSAQLHAEIAIRNNFGKLIIGVNVFPHSHWVNTECPGSLDINYIVSKANQINNFEPANVGTPVVIESPIIEQEEDSMKNKFFITNDGAALYVGAPGMKTLIHIERFETLLALREILATGESGPLSIIGVQEIQAIMSQLPA